MNRKQFLKNSSFLLGALSIFPYRNLDTNTFTIDNDFVSKRPSEKNRTFISEEVEQIILEVKSVVKDKELAWMFENCYPNTLDTTVDYEVIDGKPDTFIITGDIDAMWLRDSTAQVWPYIPLIKKDKKLKNLVLGLVNRQVKCVLTDPYANSFYKDLTKESDWIMDSPSPIPGVHERKWEIDSLCYVIRLSHKYYELTNDTSVFDEKWDETMRLIVKTFKTEQRKDGTSPYYFARNTTKMTDAPVFNGTGRPIKPTGMICSMFRPSDDATMYPYLIPSNIFAIISLQQLAEVYENVLKDSEFAEECKNFAIEIENGVKKHAIAEHQGFGEIYAYEVDGFGNKVFMDDANVPSLMSLAYLGAHKPTDKIYRNTRAFLLSDANPYYLKGKYGEGQASPHTGKEKIWPMGITLRAMTSIDKKEILACLKMLKDTHADTGFMHEAFHKDNPKDFNRTWFAWANTLFGELILKIKHENLDILSTRFD
ncbi:MAG: glycoside hydrolase family 125 protein [Flavobacterium sp.]|jgi:meiotically up-regulated gene 157 (Mug157) protein|nr:glycoside hydrolase family 125 protein [Flavobacterium sp.]